MNATFIPTQRCKDLLCALFAEFRSNGWTRDILLDLREELGKEEFSRLEKDMARLMFRCSAATTVRLCIEAAIKREVQHYQALRMTRLRGLHERPHGSTEPRPKISSRFD